MNLPSSITNSYDVEALVHHSDRTETYRLRGRIDDQIYLMKVRSISEKNTTDIEETTLERLRSHKLQTPQVVLREDTDTHCYLIREYIEGVTLETYAENVGFICEEDLLRIGIALLQELRVLHNLSEPVIHRDIKPKNILLTNPDICHNACFSEVHPPLVTLIDYDTARTFKKNATNDTQFLGTKETAAPEQYGFAQSDVRTDIFGVGKTLIYLATGTYEIAELSIRNYSKHLKKLLRACVSLDKDDRPASATVMIHQLQRLLKKTRRHEKLIGFFPWMHHYDGSYIESSESNPVKLRAIWIATTVAVAVTVGVCSYILGRTLGTPATKISASVSDFAVTTGATVTFATSDDNNTGLSLGQNSPDTAWDPTQTPPPTHQPKETVDFGGSKSLELAVRTALGVDKKTKVTYADLAGIESIFAIGNQSYSDADSYRHTDNEDQLIYNRGSYPEIETVFVEHGDISDLSLLAQMPNLKKVFLSHQPLTDISPISWSRLEDLAIVDCPVREYRPLTRLKYLTRLVLMGCQGRDVSFLSELPELRELCIGRMDLNSIGVLRDMPIESLQFEKCFLDDKGYDVIGQMPALTTLTLWNTTEDIIKKIGGSGTVQSLEIYWTSLPGGLTSLANMPSLRRLAINCATPASMDGVEKLNLQYIFPPGGLGVEWLKDCPSIEEIETSRIKRVDWDAIDRSHVQTVYATPAQKKEIKKKLKNPSFEVRDA